MRFEPKGFWVCQVCGKLKGGAGIRGQHDACAPKLQQLRAQERPKRTTKRVTDKVLDYFAKTGMDS
jgi:hypothetical protein